MTHQQVMDTSHISWRFIATKFKSKVSTRQFQSVKVSERKLTSGEQWMNKIISFTGPDLRGGSGGPGPRPPTTEGPPPNPSYFISGSIDTHIVTIYALLTSWIFFVFYCIITTTVEYILHYFSTDWKIFLH